MSLDSIISLLSYIATTLFGALMYYLIDKVKTRRRLSKGLIEELKTNAQILRNQVDLLKKDKRPLYQLTRVYHAEVFHALRITDPELYSKLLVKHPDLVEVYQELFYLNDLRYSAETAISRENLIQRLKGLQSKIEALVKEIQETLKQN